MVATKAYNIFADYIIHACGPRWDDYKKNEKENCFNDLKNTFFNALIYSETKLSNIQSIGIPLISSGIFGVPKELCCQALFEALNEYLAESNDAKRSIKLIVLINKDKPTTNELHEYFLNRIKADTDLNANYSNENENLSQNNLPVQVEREILEERKCIACNCEYTINSLYKFECGCYYCLDCKENIDQSGEKCKCSPKKK